MRRQRRGKRQKQRKKRYEWHAKLTPGREGRDEFADVVGRGGAKEKRGRAQINYQLATINEQVASNSGSGAIAAKKTPKLGMRR